MNWNARVAAAAADRLRVAGLTRTRPASPPPVPEPGPGSRAARTSPPRDRRAAAPRFPRGWRIRPHELAPAVAIANQPTASAAMPTRATASSRQVEFSFGSVPFHAPLSSLPGLADGLALESCATRQRPRFAPTVGSPVPRLPKAGTKQDCGRLANCEGRINASGVARGGGDAERRIAIPVRIAHGPLPRQRRAVGGADRGRDHLDQVGADHLGPRRHLPCGPSSSSALLSPPGSGVPAAARRRGRGRRCRRSRTRGPRRPPRAPGRRPPRSRDRGRRGRRGW